MAAQLEAESLRAQTRRQAAERALQQQARQQRQQRATGGGIGAGRVTTDQAMILAGLSPDTGQPYTEEEWELRERLRLEALKRRSRSLRSSPVAQSHRQLDGTAQTSAGAPASAGPAPERDYSSPARLGAPEDPPGWERIHEGSFLEAALVTQLSGGHCQVNWLPRVQATPLSIQTWFY